MKLSSPRIGATEILEINPVRSYDLAIARSALAEIVDKIL